MSQALGSSSARVWGALLGRGPLAAAAAASAAGLPVGVTAEALAELLAAGRVAPGPEPKTYRVRSELGWCPGCGDGPGGGGALLYCSRCGWEAAGFGTLPDEEERAG